MSKKILLKLAFSFLCLKSMQAFSVTETITDDEKLENYTCTLLASNHSSSGNECPKLTSVKRVPMDLPFILKGPSCCGKLTEDENHTLSNFYSSGQCLGVIAGLTSGITLCSKGLIPSSGWGACFSVIGITIGAAGLGVLGAYGSYYCYENYKYKVLLDVVLKPENQVDEIFEIYLNLLNKNGKAGNRLEEIYRSIFDNAIKDGVKHSNDNHNSNEIEIEMESLAKRYLHAKNNYDCTSHNLKAVSQINHNALLYAGDSDSHADEFINVKNLANAELKNAKAKLKECVKSWMLKRGVEIAKEHQVRFDKLRNRYLLSEE